MSLPEALELDDGLQDGRQATIPQARHGKAQLQAALRQTQRSTFTIFSREVPL
jgi:hypothetical protein